MLTFKELLPLGKCQRTSAGPSSVESCWVDTQPKAELRRFWLLNQPACHALQKHEEGSTPQAASRTSDSGYMPAGLACTACDSSKMAFNQQQRRQCVDTDLDRLR
eukprot:GHUV01038319.1.p1 GENE.GHUV01038319.1~~GHUV01038319.1.p1  ORF type:complete len:105 (+),score=19.76 GHUV01038319.1:683-997(+)